MYEFLQVEWGETNLAADSRFLVEGVGVKPSRVTRASCYAVQGFDDGSELVLPREGPVREVLEARLVLKFDQFDCVQFDLFFHGSAFGLSSIVGSRQFDELF